VPNFKRLRKELDEFHRSKKPELELAPIEKWMVRNLGVKKIGMKGVKVSYFHSALTATGRDGVFTIHVVHGRRRVKVNKHDFCNFLYKRLLEIIDVMDKENSNAR